MSEVKTNAPVLELENITMQFGGVVAINNLSLKVNRGEIVALIGPNGAGKTTAFNCVTGVYEPTNGIVYFHGEPIVANHPQGKMVKQYGGINGDLYKNRKPVVHTPDKITHMGIARTFQNIRLFSNLSVEDNVKIGLHNQEPYSALTGVLRLPKYWRQGYGTDTVKQLMKIAHDLGLETVTAQTDPENKACVGLLRSMGFTASSMGWFIPEEAMLVAEAGMKLSHEMIMFRKNLDNNTSLSEGRP